MHYTNHLFLLDNFFLFLSFTFILFCTLKTETTTTTKQSSTTSSEENDEILSKPVSKDLTTIPSSSSSSSIIVDAVGEKEKSENDDTNCDNLDKKCVKKVTFKQTISETSDQCKVKRVYNPNFAGPIVSIIKKESLKYPILVYKTNWIVRPSRLTEIVKNSSNNIDKLNSLKFGREYSATSTTQQCLSSPTITASSSLSPSSSSSSSSSNVIVASKFNLPKLSANSSRVIKPNKRFLFDTGAEEPSVHKKKVIKASPWGEGGEASTNSSSLLKDKKNFGFNFVDELDLKSKKQQKAQTSSSSSSQQLQPSSLKLSLALKKEEDDNKLSILRKPVLQLSTFSLFGSPSSQEQQRDPNTIKSPFSIQLNSSNLSSTSSIFTKSLVCNVCNSITTRKQPRKYGAICCELCKKFMSKMIEKVNKHPVQHWQCDKTDGK